MVLAEQHAATVPEATDERLSPSAIGWPSLAELRKSAPVLRLLAEIWANPWVYKVGVTVDGSDVQVWVFVPEDDREAELKVWDAERMYLNATPPHHFTIWIIPRAKVRDDLLPPFETILER